MFICTQFIYQLPVGLLAQLVERCTGIAEVMGSNPVRAWNFFQVLLTTTSFSSVLSCEDLLISSLHRSAIMWNFHISKILNQYCSNFLSCLLVAYNKKIIIRNKIQVTRRKETLYNILCWLPSTLLINKAIQLIIILEFHGTSQGLIPSQLGRRRLFSERVMAVRAYQCCMQVYLFFLA